MKHVDKIAISFAPSGKTVYVLPGTTALEAAAEADIILTNPCGGVGTCGKCLVQLVQMPAAEPPGKRGARTAAGTENGAAVLACQTPLWRNSRVFVPETSFCGVQKILSDTLLGRCSYDPPVKKVKFNLPPPSRKHPASDCARFLEQVGALDLSLQQVKQLSAFLRRNQWSGTAARGYNKLLALEKGDTTGQLYGVAFDLGTTTIAGSLIDLHGCKKLDTATAINRQIGFGDDVISRISSIIKNPANRKEMQLEVVESLNGVINELTSQAGISHEAIYDVAIAGNAPMQQILCGLDVSPLGQVPFVQAFDKALQCSARNLGITVHPEALIYVFPQLGGFIGGDTVAGLLGVDFAAKITTSLFIDIGTNGEIVLKHGDKTYAASTAAGPAFEGARIRQGMRGAAGAIEKVILEDDDIQINVIDNTKPVGICGSGLIDALSVLLSAGVVGPNGKLRGREECGDTVPDNLRERVVIRNGQRAFVLATEEESGLSGPVCLWQKDVCELQLAIAAIRAGAETVLKQAGIASHQLDEILLAGGFGNFIRRKHAQRTGLLPPLEHEKIKFIGNASLRGAEMALLSRVYQKEAEQLQSHVQHVDISLDPDFNDLYAAYMMFPEC